MKYDLIFEGGGAKGLAHVGAMEAFLAAKHTPGRLVGTSAGAMTAGLLAAGFTPQDLKAAALERLPDGRPVFSGFMDTPDRFADITIRQSWLYATLQRVGWSLIPAWLKRRFAKAVLEDLLEDSSFRELFAFAERGGLYSGMTLYNWLHDKLATKGLGNATFAEFAAQTGSDLSVVASDTHSHQMLVLNQHTSPDCPVAWGIRMSMNIPFVWEEVLWGPKWGTYRGQDMAWHSVVDGGLISNFALELLVSDTPEVRAVMGAPTGNRVLGFLLDGTLPVPNAPPRPWSPPSATSTLEADAQQSRLVQRIERTLDTMTSARDSFVMGAFPADICHLPVQGYGTTEFDMSAERITAIIAGGHDAAEHYFAQGRDKTV